MLLILECKGWHRKDDVTGFCVKILKIVCVLEMEVVSAMGCNGMGRRNDVVSTLWS